MPHESPFDLEYVAASENIEGLLAKIRRLPEEARRRLVDALAVDRFRTENGFDRLIQDERGRVIAVLCPQESLRLPRTTPERLEAERRMAEFRANPALFEACSRPTEEVGERVFGPRSV